jgi:hypothetical protein
MMRLGPKGDSLKFRRFAACGRHSPPVLPQITPFSTGSSAGVELRFQTPKCCAYSFSACRSESRFLRPLFATRKTETYRKVEDCRRDRLFIGLCCVLTVIGRNSQASVGASGCYLQLQDAPTVRNCKPYSECSGFILLICFAARQCLDLRDCPLICSQLLVRDGTPQLARVSRNAPHFGVGRSAQRWGPSHPPHQSTRHNELAVAASILKYSSD